MAARDINQALAGTSPESIDRVWYSLQALLVAAADVSKLLWPTKQKFSDRGLELRRSLGVPQPSPLQPRALRDTFEHFDERLDEWVLRSRRSERRIFADSNIGPPGMIGGVHPDDILRQFDPATAELIFRGERFQLPPIIRALQDLGENARTQARKPPLSPGERPSG